MSSLGKSDAIKDGNLYEQCIRHNEDTVVSNKGNDSNSIVSRHPQESPLSKEHNSTITLPFWMQQNLNVYINIISVGLSLIDSEPTEIVYFSMQDIFGSIERTSERITVSFTVQNAQLDNQLLNPLFPINLNPRVVSPSNITGGSEGGRLMLPGLRQLEGSFPTIHIFSQEKLDPTKDLNVTRQSTIVRYYDMLSIWIAPIEIKLEEETIIRLRRIFYEIKNVLKIPKSNASGSAILSLFGPFEDQDEDDVDIASCRGIMDIDPMVLAARNKEFACLNLRHYSNYTARNKPLKSVYFSLLQLHPVDMIVTFKNSPEFKPNATEENIISMVAQLDTVRLCLNALVAEHAFGSTSFFIDVIMKHYRNAFWRQVYKLIGSTDIVEGSVGLVANLGTGVYDFFYEPIDGLLGENGSFLQGLSKGGISLASRTIGGTSGFTSKLTGGIGKGVSMLTLDSEYQVQRAKNKLQQAHSLTEGLYVGTKELGTNIVEGVAGIIVAPYKGWKEDGGVGLGIGIAKGLLGVAFKPAVGVFDFASRAAEGIRYSAFSGLDPAIDEHLRNCKVEKKRPPRTFGRGGQILPYDPEAAAAQLVIDRLTGFKRHARFLVIHHLGFDRTLPAVLSNRVELSGMMMNTSYLVLVSCDRVILVASIGKGTLDLVWSCPAENIEQMYNDTYGDLIISMNNPIKFGDVWDDVTPIVKDGLYQDNVTLQLVLEQSIGTKRARRHPLCPMNGDMEGTLLKKYVSGFRSVLLSNSKHFYQLYGNALYEYTVMDGKIKSTSTTAMETSTSKSKKTGSNSTDTSTMQELFWKLPPGILTCVYPLYDIVVEEPKKDEGGRYSIRLYRKTSHMNICVAYRDENDERLSIGSKEDLVLVMASLKSAYVWKQAIESNIVYETDDIIDHSSTNISRKNTTYSMNITAAFQSSSYQQKEEIDMEGSVLCTLVLPTACCDHEAVEKLKIEIARTLSLVKRSRLGLG